MQPIAGFQAQALASRLPIETQISGPCARLRVYKISLPLTSSLPYTHETGMIYHYSYYFCNKFIKVRNIFIVVIDVQFKCDRMVSECRNV